MQSLGEVEPTRRIGGWAYIEPMELQTQIDELKTSVKRQKLINIALAGVIVVGGGVAAIQPAGDAEFGTITCKEWRVVDKDGKVRIGAVTGANGDAGVQWKDKDGKVRITAATYGKGTADVQWLDKDCKPRISALTTADGQAGLGWWDKDGKMRITAATGADGDAAVTWWDKDGKQRIRAATYADGTVVLPTSDLKPK